MNYSKEKNDGLLGLLTMKLNLPKIKVNYLFGVLVIATAFFMEDQSYNVLYWRVNQFLSFQCIANWQIAKIRNAIVIHIRIRGVLIQKRKE